MKLNQKGMSIIEILIVITLIGLIGTFVAGKIFDQLAEGQIESAKIQIQRLGERLKEYRRHCGAYPTTDQGLDALITKPTSGRECKRYRPGGYIENQEIPIDPWENEFIYESDGRTYTIISLGSDGIEGGEGADADISNNKDRVSDGDQEEDI